MGSTGIRKCESMINEIYKEMQEMSRLRIIQNIYLETDAENL